MMSYDRQVNTVPPGRVSPPGCSARREVAEQERLPVGVVVGVRLAQGVRVDAQAGDESLFRRLLDDVPFRVALDRGAQSATRPSAFSNVAIVFIATA